MKSKNIKLLCLLFVIVTFCAGCGKSGREYYAYNGNVSVSVGMGREDFLVYDRNVPVKVKVEGEYAQKGGWCVLTVPNNENDFYAYRQPLTEENVQELEFVVPVAAGSSQLVIELLDENENVIYSRTKTYDLYSPFEIMIIGRLEQQSDTIPWPDVIEAYSGDFVVEAISMTAENVYSDPSAYDMFECIVIDKGRYDEMDILQRAALLEWVKNGGELIQENMTGLCDTLDDSVLYSEYRLDDDNHIDVCNVGKGRIWSTQEMLSTLMPKMSDYQKKTFILDISGRDLVEETVIQEDNDSRIEELLDNRRISSETPSIWLFAGLLSLYLFAVIPGVYVLSRRRKQLRWMRLSMCLMALVFSAVIFAVGSKTRFDNPFIRDVVFVRYTGDEKKEEIYFGIQAPYNTGYNLSVDNTYSVFPMKSYEFWRQDSYNDYRRHTVLISSQQSGTDISISNLVAFTPRYFKLEQTEKNHTEPEGTIICNQADDTLTGSMVNTMGMDISDVVIVWKEKVYLLNDWAENETADLETMLKDGRIQELTRTQFAEGGYRNRGGWDSSLSGYYEYCFSRLSPGDDRMYIIGTVDYSAEFQQETDYSVSGSTLLIAEKSVEQK